MRIMVIGATGTIGREIVNALAAQHDIVSVSRSHTPLTVELTDQRSIRALYRAVGTVDAIVCAAGSAKFALLDQMTDQDLELSLNNKLMGQVNVVRFGLHHVADGGSITVTSGTWSRAPMKGSAAISLVNAALEGFVRAAALEAPRRIRVNVVSPPAVKETLIALKMDHSSGLPAATVASSYVQSVVGTQTGAVIEPA